MMRDCTPFASQSSGEPSAIEPLARPETTRASSLARMLTMKTVGADKSPSTRTRRGTLFTFGRSSSGAVPHQPGPSATSCSSSCEGSTSIGLASRCMDGAKLVRSTTTELSKSVYAKARESAMASANAAEKSLSLGISRARKETENQLSDLANLGKDSLGEAVFMNSNGNLAMRPRGLRSCIAMTRR